MSGPHPLAGKRAGAVKSFEIVLLYDFYGGMLTDKQREIFSMYYNEDMSLAEIAENEGISRQGARDAVVRAEAALRELEERLGLFRRYGGISESVSRIGEAARAIIDINARFYAGAELERAAHEILAITDEIIGA